MEFFASPESPARSDVGRGIPNNGEGLRSCVLTASIPARFEVSEPGRLARRYRRRTHFYLVLDYNMVQILLRARETALQLRSRWGDALERVRGFPSHAPRKWDLRNLLSPTQPQLHMSIPFAFVFS